MDIQIIKGNLTHVSDCEAALTHSSLGAHYFEKEGSARKAIEEGLSSGELYVAMVQGRCAGFIFFLPEGAFHSFPYLHVVAVKAEYRSLGIGKKLVDFFENAVPRDKYFLVVADFNPDAKRFYERIGYKQVGAIPGLYREGITEYLMMKEKSR